MVTCISRFSHDLILISYTNLTTAHLDVNSIQLINYISILTIFIDMLYNTNNMSLI
jgi:hypothetical protein